MTPAELNQKLGAIIREKRVLLGLSQEALGQRIGVTFQQVQKYEKGTNRVSASRLVQIAAVFGVSVDTLFTGATAEVDPNAEPLPTMSREATVTTRRPSATAPQRAPQASRHRCRAMGDSPATNGGEQPCIRL